MEKTIGLIVYRAKHFLVDRLGKDIELKREITAQLFNNPSPHQKVTNINLLRQTGNLTEQVYNWCIQEIDRQKKENNSPEVGYDIFSQRLQVVTHTLLDAIS